MKTKAIIQEVLDDLSDGQWNLQAHGARDLIAGLITDQITIYIWKKTWLFLLIYAIWQIGIALVRGSLCVYVYVTLVKWS